MNKPSVLAVVPLMIAVACSAQTNSSTSETSPATPVPTNAPSVPKSTITVQEMLVSGPTQLKLHSLAMISQGNIKGDVDESYLPGFTVCAENPALPLRSVTAQLLGQHYVQGKDNPNPEAIDLLVKLAKDESSYVRYNAVYYGLTQIKNKSDAIIDLLIDSAIKDREPGLLDRIEESLKPDQERVAKLLDKKMQEGDDVAYFEIYSALTGHEPSNAEKYLDMPSSRPRLFLFKISGTDSDAYKANLVEALEDAGIKNPNVTISGEDESAVASVRTYITKDRLVVEKEFSDNPEFKLMQALWLSPELDIQLQKMQQK